MLSRWYKPLCAGLAGLFLAIAGYELWYAFAVLDYWKATGGDLAIYTEATGRLFSGGSWFLPSQLAGPHPLTMGDVLYPPTAAWLFLPFRVVGYSGLLALWAGVMVWSVRHAAPWTWPIMALILALPPSILAINAGNPTVLVAITVALALRWPVFGPLALLKPTMAPFAFIGIRSRWWWAGAGLIALGTLPFIAETLIYPQVILWTEGTGGAAYSLWHWPLVMLPLVPAAHQALVPAVRRVERRLTRRDEGSVGVPVMEQGPMRHVLGGRVGAMYAVPADRGIVGEPEAVPAGR